MGLRKYNQKRDFTLTKEPKGTKAKSATGDFFCVQKHDATRLHYDFRLELDGVLLSWAVTKGPSPNPGDKRLAVRTEDHPLDYGTFEGIIPKGQYGGGTVMLWDVGTWEPIENPRAGLKSGKLKFILHGERLKGEWTLVRMRGKEGEKRENWLLIKDQDKEVKKDAKFLDKYLTSVKTRRSMEEIASNTNSKVWQSNKASKSDEKNDDKNLNSRLQNKIVSSDISKLVKKYTDVQLATLVDEAPGGSGWVHEVKFDGYRLLGHVSDNDVRLITRNGNDWTGKFSDIKKALSRLSVENAVVDMEAVVLDEDGKTNFQKLQNSLSEDIEPVPIHAYAFDLLHLNGKDLRGLPLLERKESLENLIPGKGVLHYSEHHQGDGGDMIAQACKLGVEGIISKRADSSYSGKRGRDWLKVKCVKRQEFIILGYTDSTTGANVIGALHLGYYKDKKLRYAGKVGTGYTAKSARDIYKILKSLPAVSAPDVVPRAARRASHWVKPEQLCEVSFGMWTDDGHIRHASFHALRMDKDPKQVTQEKPIHTPKTQSSSRQKHGANLKPKKMDSGLLRNDESNEVLSVTITHPERVVFEPLGLQKIDLASYYGIAAPYILKDIKDHPITLLRCPDGANKECFYQRNPAKGMGSDIKPFPWKHKGNAHTYFYTDSAQGIVQMIQMGAIELHTWGARFDDIDHPDRIIFDCDPDPGVPFEAVKLAVQDLRARLENLGLESFVKCTGGKGLHVRVPIAPKTPWNDVKNFARSLCEQMALETPEAYVTTMTKSKRKGKIFLDFFRNDYTATAVADYAVRAREGAPVALPIEWDELDKLKKPNQFSLDDALKRIAKKPDTRRYTLKQTLSKKILKSIT